MHVTFWNREKGSDLPSLEVSSCSVTIVHTQNMNGLLVEYSSCKELILLKTCFCSFRFGSFPLGFFLYSSGSL